MASGIAVVAGSASGGGESTIFVIPVVIVGHLLLTSAATRL